jgi:ABC-2 type transport system ATP-binding protein
VRVLDVDPATATLAWRARLGSVPQDCSDLLDLTVRVSVQYFSSLHPSPRGTDVVLKPVGLTEKAGSRVKTLSGGRRRRLDVVLGIVGDPERSSWRSRRRASTQRRAARPGS